jgi:hypothetical protein
MRMIWARLSLNTLLLLAAAALPGQAQNAAQQRTAAPPTAKVYFIDLPNGARIPGKVKIHFGISDMGVAPAGMAKANTGHHHLLIDTELPPLDQPIPSDFNHVHFGSGQTEADLVLSPGEHTLQLLFADHNHIPHNPPVISEKIHVVVVGDADEKPRTPAPADASVFFIGLNDGATIPSHAKIRFGASNIDVVPAGTNRPNTGHHHLLIDTGLPPLDREIPSDFNHIHFGRGQTEADLDLPPGEHTLQLLMADYEHVPHDPPVMSARIRVRVAATPGAGSAIRSMDTAATSEPTPSGRKPSPPDAAVYFIYPHDGETIFPNSTIRFGLRNMGVAPAGVVKPNTGHHHLLVDTDTPPPDAAIPSDFNHIHLGGGQTEKKITLKPGRHTLQLILGDDQHMPHDPPVMSERITVLVKAGRRPVRRP